MNIRRVILGFVLVGLFATANPALAADSFADAFVGKVKVAEAKGDLDGDGIDDLAFIVHRDPKAVALPPVDGADANNDDALPQTVLLFRGDKSGKYALWKVGEHHFVSSIPLFMEDNGLGTFEIKKGVLTVGSSESLSSGSWTSADCTVKWRNTPAGFRLIGLSVVEVDRSCACVSSSDTNLVTGLEIRTSDRDSGGRKRQKDRKTKTRGKPRVVVWESFDWDEACAVN